MQKIYFKLPFTHFFQGSYWRKYSSKIKKLVAKKQKDTGYRKYGLQYKSNKKCPRMIFIHQLKLAARLLWSPSHVDGPKTYILEYLIYLCEKQYLKDFYYRKRKTDRQTDMSKTVGNQDLIVTCIFSSNFVKIILKTDTIWL